MEELSNRPKAKRPRTWTNRAAWAVVAAAAFYGGFLLLGFVPQNLDYARPAEYDAVRIFVRSNEIHTDLVLPVICDDPAIDWRRRFPPRHFQSPVADDRYVAVGWGNRQFYVETPRWADLKVSSAVVALCWPSETVLHVEYLPDAAGGETFRELWISRQQYRDLATFVESSIGATDAQGAAEPATTVTYHSRDRFYLASGRYHAFNTCNQWTGRGLAAAGAPVGIWTPLQPHVLWRLP
jgi:uncharacterized protein (TIGR02117 family)